MENQNTFSSQITFLNFKDFECGKNFMKNILGLPEVYNIGWAVVYRAAEKAFLGVVDSDRSELGKKDGFLISLTTDDAEKFHEKISLKLGDRVSTVKEIPDAGLKSFFFTGPEGFNFEIEEFILPEVKSIF